MAGEREGTPSTVHITRSDEIEFKKESEVVDIFFVKAIVMVLFLGVCVFAILSKYKKEVMAFFKKTSSLSNEKTPMVKSIKLSPKTSLYIVNTGEKTFAVAESLININTLYLSEHLGKLLEKEAMGMQSGMQVEAHGNINSGAKQERQGEAGE